MNLASNVKERAVIMRKKGYSLQEISDHLNIAKSTASLWLTDIVLNNNANKRIRERKILGCLHAAKTKIDKRKKQYQGYLLWAKRNLKKMSLNKEYCQLMSSLLYWAEGGKFMDNHLEFTNSDPKMIETFLKLLRKGFDIDETKFRLNIHIHEYHNDIKQKMFWSNITKISLSQVNKSYLKPHSGKRTRENYPGCVRICYYSADIARRVKALYQSLIDYV